LVIYTAAFIAEIVRAGIQAVSRGQVEAARSLGLKPFQSLRLVIFPQALRVVIPPLISQYLNLTKNSSLAIAIGYPDLFAVGRIMINQAGRAVSVFIMIMAAYLLLSLTYSVILNLYNRRVAFTER
jgi:general L-amino acid transport system permease protein